MDNFNFERFQLSNTGYIYVSRKTRKIHAIALHDNDIRLVQDEDKEAHLLIKGLLLTGHLYYRKEFYRLMEFVNKYDDSFILDALLAFRECCHNAKFDAATQLYLS